MSHETMNLHWWWGGAKKLNTKYMHTHICTYSTMPPIMPLAMPQWSPTNPSSSKNSKKDRWKHWGGDFEWWLALPERGGHRYSTKFKDYPYVTARLRALAQHQPRTLFSYQDPHQNITTTNYNLQCILEQHIIIPQRKKHKLSYYITTRTIYNPKHVNQQITQQIKNEWGEAIKVRW